MILAWLLLLTGLTISAVAIYYSVVGLTAIFSAAVIPIIIMGSALEVGKLVCASWLKANWERAPRFIKYYMIIAVIVLMIITSMGIFGFLSKAHNDQNLVSGDVQSKIAIYDEKIKTEKENIDANRKVLKQLDESVDQVMGRSSDEKGAEKAVAIRKAQQKERSRIAQDIAESQKKIAGLNEERAPIAAEVRKVEAEVGPIKYIAKFIYGDHGADENMLEKAVTWIIVLIVVVFDPLAVIMLLAAQMTFGWDRKQPSISDFAPHPTELVVEPEQTKADEILQSGVANGNPNDNIPLTTDFEGVREPGGEWIQTGPEFETIEQTHIDEFQEPKHVTPATALGGDITAPEEITADSTESVSELDKWNKMIEEAEREAARSEQTTVEQRLATGQSYIDSEGTEQTTEPTKPEPDLPTDESKKKTYMIKDESGQVQTKVRE
jgi:hypothetical protein